MKPVPLIVALLGSAIVLNCGGIYTPASGQTPANSDPGPAKELTAYEWFKQADAKSKQGDYRGALADYTVVIELDPQNAVAFNNRGKARSELGDIEGAIADMTRSIQLAPDASLGYYNRGISQKALGNRRQAIADLTRAIQLDNSWGEELRLGDAYKVRGEVWLDAGNRQRASADFRQALALGTQEDISQELTEQLQRAVRTEQWEEAIFLVDVMIEAFPQQAGELSAYRARLQRM